MDTNPKSKIQNLKSASLAISLLIVPGLACSAPQQPAAKPAALPLEQIKLPAGFSIGLFSDRVPGARSMARSPKGILYVGTRGQGNVYALVDRDRDGRADEVRTIAAGLSSPNGVAWKDGALYVAEIS